MAISLTAYAKADIRAAKSALEAVKAKEGNEKATKGIAAYHAQQAYDYIHAVFIQGLFAASRAYTAAGERRFGK